MDKPTKAVRKPNLPIRLFVYGTLKTKKEPTHRLRDFKMLSIDGGFPGAIEEEGAHIDGEIIDIDTEDRLERIHQIEGFRDIDSNNNMYQFMKGQVYSLYEGEETRSVPEDIYFYRWNGRKDYPVVQNGIWMNSFRFSY